MPNSRASLPLCCLVPRDKRGKRQAMYVLYVCYGGVFAVKESYKMKENVLPYGC